MSKVDPFELPKEQCGQGCDKGSRCILPDGHHPPDYHVTEHGCVYLDPAKAAEAIVSKVSDPPEITTEDLIRIEQESKLLHEAFIKRTASMEKMTSDDLKTIIR